MKQYGGLGIILGLVMALGLCGAGPGEAQEARYLEVCVWYDGPRAGLRPLQDLGWLFQQGRQGVLVQIMQQPTFNAYPMLRRWAQGQTAGAPTLVVVNDRWMEMFGGALQPLEELRADPEAQGLLPEALELFTAGGRLRAAPWSVGARVLLMRSDLPAEKNLPAPRTWEELGKVASALHDPPRRYGMGLAGISQGGGALLLQELIWAEGGPAKPGEVPDLTAAPVLRALERYCRLAAFAPPEVLSWNQRELEELFLEGRLGLLVTDTWVAKEWEGREEAPPYVVLPLPGGKQPVAHLLGDGLAVLAANPEAGLGVEFARMLLSRRSQEKLMQWGGVAVHRELFARGRRDPLLGAVVASLETGPIFTGQPPPLMEAGLEYALHAALSGRKTPAEALQEAQELIEKHATPPTGAPAGAPAPGDAPAGAAPTGAPGGVQ